ncbi:MAG: DUF6883 domain-containing protein [Acidobacteriota bacterium]
MRVPNAEHAVIATDKFTGYLRNLSHKRGGAKARLLVSFGCQSDKPDTSKPTFGLNTCPST